MRELSEQEKAFLEVSLPEGTQSQASRSRPRRKRHAGSAVGSRLFSTLRLFLSYIPLAIGIGTLAIAALATYLYIWGRDFFKISEVERLNADGTLELLDSASGDWFADTLQIFAAAPWVILCTVIGGILLMGLSMLLVRKNTDG